MCSCKSCARLSFTWNQKSLVLNQGRGWMSRRAPATNSIHSSTALAMMGSLGCMTCFKVLHMPGRRAGAFGAVCLSGGIVQPGVLVVCEVLHVAQVAYRLSLFRTAVQSPCCCELRAAKLLKGLRAGALAGLPVSACELRLCGCLLRRMTVAG